MDKEIIISIENIHKSFGNVSALQGVSFEVEKGTILGLLGPNGAGKTTLVKILATLSRPDRGSAKIADIDVVKNPGEARAKIGLTGQFAAIDENLTGRENLELVGSLYHLPRALVKKRAQELLEKFSLTSAAKRLARTYSGGMKRRLDVAASLIGEPEILFLDEPTTGLDPKSRLELWEIIERLVHGGTTVLLTTQYLEEADRLSDNIVIIDKGKVVAEGTARSLKSKTGNNVLEVHIENIGDIDKAAEVLQKFNPHIARNLGLLGMSLKAEEGTKQLIEAGREIDSAGLKISDIELRKPTLDEVFLTLTGNSNEPK